VESSRAPDRLLGRDGGGGITVVVVGVGDPLFDSDVERVLIKIGISIEHVFESVLEDRIIGAGNADDRVDRVVVVQKLHRRPR
jgi:hypothetical protein